MRTPRLALCILLTCLIVADAARARKPDFVVKPYLQVGRQSQSLVWFCADEDVAWTVAVNNTQVRGEARRLVIGGRPLRQVIAVLPALPPARPFDYHVQANGTTVFQARGMAPPAKSAGYHAVLFGDAADGSGSERVVAAAMYRAHPDIVLVAGDIVYPRGTWGDYVRNFFPVYNADRVVAGVGVPLMRAVTFVAAPGNHDIPATQTISVNFSRLADALAYFYAWVQPLDGPPVKGAPLRGPTSEFLAAAGGSFPRMASFSFDWGNTHWLVLDSNPYNDFTDPALERWVSADLAAAKGAAWRFVLFHHAPFHSSKAHANDQWMRVLQPAFERGRVDVVFAGHVHNYERTWPLHFKPRPHPDGRLIDREGTVEGQLTLDRRFDGVKNTRPDGIVNVVSGAGGAPLYEAPLPHDYTCRYIANVWSFTDIRVDERSLTVRQIGIEGNELDRFTITR